MLIRCTLFASLVHQVLPRDGASLSFILVPGFHCCPGTACGRRRRRTRQGLATVRATTPRDHLARAGSLLRGPLKPSDLFPHQCICARARFFCRRWRHGSASPVLDCRCLRNLARLRPNLHRCRPLCRHRNAGDASWPRDLWVQRRVVRRGVPHLPIHCPAIRLLLLQQRFRREHTVWAILMRQ